jgi:hypothetical protein
VFTSRHSSLVLLTLPVTLPLGGWQVVYDSYQLSAFSFFPALPWKAMKVPPNVPHPAKVMMAGFFEFEGVDTQLLGFVGCVAMVPVAFCLYALTMPGGLLPDAERNLKVIEIFFDTLFFMAIKKLTGVFACSSASTFIVGEDGQARAFCKLHDAVHNGSTVENEAATPIDMCMDNDPTVACFGQAHWGYMIFAMVLLPPYYCAALKFQLDAQVTPGGHSCILVFSTL